MKTTYRLSETAFQLDGKMPLKQETAETFLNIFDCARLHMRPLYVF